MQVVLHASLSSEVAETNEKEAALRQNLSAARDAELSVMRSLQSELRRSACVMQVITIVSALLSCILL